MRRRIIIFTTCIIFLGVLYLPLFHYLVLPLPSIKLGGKTKKTIEKPGLNADDFLAGKFQTNFERWYKRGSGIWPYLVRSENQLNFSLFKLASTNYKSTVVVGKDRNLIERGYLRAASDLDSASVNRLRKKVKKLKELQDVFKKRGVEFLVMISPNKPGLYPEFIPSAYKLDGSEERQSKYERTVPLLDEIGVNYFDAFKFLKDRMPEDPYPFFDFSGTHWNEYGSCLVGHELINRSQNFLGKNLVNFSCNPVQMETIPGYSERDLARILNIWWPQATYSDSPRPRSKRLVEGGEYRPNVLFVGTSFMWALLRHLDVHRVYRKRDFYYYYKRNNTYPKRSFRTINKSKLDWDKQVFNKDLVILEVNEAFVSRVGYGFIKDALAAGLFTSQGYSDTSNDDSILASNFNARKNRLNKKQLRKGAGNSL